MGGLTQMIVFLAMSGALFLSGMQAQVVIQFTEADLQVSEMDEMIEICVEVTGGNLLENAVVELNSGKQGDSATNGADYIALDQERLTFTPGGVPNRCVAFMVRIDDELEGTETVTVSLTIPQINTNNDFTIGRETVVVSILDSNNVTVGFEFPSYTVREGSGQIEVCAIRLDGIVSRQLTLEMAVIPDAMSQGNASSDINSLDFAIVQESVDLMGDRACGMFGSLDDNDAPILEELEFYQITLTVGDTAVVEPGSSVADIFIEDNDGATVTIVTNSAMMQEGNSGDLTPFEVCVMLTNIQSGLMRDLIFSLSVEFITSDNQDFLPSDPQPLTFPSDSMVGDTECVTFQIQGDDYKEADEMLNITLAGEKLDDIISNPQISLTIEDDGDLIQFCEGLPDPTNGFITLTGMIENSVATYNCDEGYILEGDMTRTCQRNAATIPGVWSGSEPTCRIADCDSPPLNMNDDKTEVDFTTTTYRSEAIYSCPDPCYQLVPNTDTLMCQANEEWSPSTPPQCQLIGCGPPPEFDNCTLMSTNNNCGSMTSYSPLDSETIRIFGDTELTCGSDGMWQADPVEGFPFCIPRGICPEPPTPISDGCLVDISRPGFNSLEADAVADYSCPPGCFLNPSNATSRTCIMITLTEGMWSGETPSCTGVICPDLMSPTNGNVDDQNNRFGGIATYSCMLGYMLDGEAERMCGPDGNWTGEAPSCVPVECPTLTLANGDVNMTGIHPGDTAMYSCDEGYTLEGPETRECQLTGAWSGDEPQCLLDCENDNDLSSVDGTSSTDALTHGTVNVFTCITDECFFERTCNNGTWSGDMPSCQSPRCLPLTSNDSSLNITHDAIPKYRSVAVYTCENGIEGTVNTRTCECSGDWSFPIPICAARVDNDDDDFPIGAIIGIAIAGAIILLILVVLLICCIAYCVRSRRNYDKKLDSAYREFMRPYTTPYDTSNPSTTPLVAAPQPRQEPPPPVEEMEKEILRSEDNLHDEDDDLPSPTPSDEEMDEYRLRMADVETQSTGSQHRIKPRIVAEKVEVDI